MPFFLQQIVMKLCTALLCLCVVASVFAEPDAAVAPVGRADKPAPPPPHRKYSQWTKWSHCSRHCKQKRFRSCLLPDDEERLCGHGAAPRSMHPRHVEDVLGTTNSVLEELFYSDWTRWSRCFEQDCKQYRTKVCNFFQICGDRILVQQKSCLGPAACAVTAAAADKEGGPSGADDGSDTARSQASPAVSDVLDPARSPDSRTCGISAVSAADNGASVGGVKLKIFGGRASAAGRWPWQVSLLNSHFENYCAGTLISNWIVTAAHCIRRRMYIKLGEHNVNKHEETEQYFRPIKIIIHPQFNVRTIENDIALIKISSNIEWSSHVRPACLPLESELEGADLLANSTKCVVVGWGKRKPDHRFGVDVLHEAEVEVISDARCRQTYATEHVITQRMMCAGSGRHGRSDTCEGDSGGPLVCQIGQVEPGKPDARPWKLFGVTSFGDSCGKKDKFGVYTKVSMYLGWINSRIAHNS
ncbi:putative Trypsin [Hypsibius exemplaris]|uniref:Trypsin n=1 Tax=Hypsibius exemplaris TaxID=2072580 RepID=A0A1W0WKI5_HYPEX|nr:putative Trypsin [Hypsibius exemplaris]